MKPRVYVETTVIGYLTSWPSGDLVVAGRQKITRDWWQHATQAFDLVASELVHCQGLRSIDDLYARRAFGARCRCLMTQSLRKSGEYDGRMHRNSARPVRDRRRRPSAGARERPAVRQLPAASAGEQDRTDGFRSCRDMTNAGTGAAHSSFGQRIIPCP